MNVTWRDYLILVLAGLLVGTYAALGTGFRYDLLIFEVGLVVAAVLIVLAHFVLSGVKALSFALLVVLLGFAGAALATFVHMKGGV